MCFIHFFVLSNGTMVSRKSDCVICVGLKTLRRKASGLKRVRLKRSDPPENLKPLYDEGGGFFVGFWTKFRWPLAQVSVKFGECICCSVYTCFAFCVYVTSFFVTLLNYFFNLGKCILDPPCILFLCFQFSIFVYNLFIKCLLFQCHQILA